jgi:hypothetical protein
MFAQCTGVHLYIVELLCFNALNGTGKASSFIEDVICDASTSAHIKNCGFSLPLNIHR